MSTHAGGVSDLRAMTKIMPVHSGATVPGFHRIPRTSTLPELSHRTRSLNHRPVRNPRCLRD